MSTEIVIYTSPLSQQPALFTPTCEGREARPRVFHRADQQRPHAQDVSPTTIMPRS